MGQNSGEDLGFGGKMLIILYGLGLAVLGAQPLQKEYGSLRNFVNVQWRHLSSSGEDLLSDVGVELSSRKTPNKEVKTLAFPETKTTRADVGRGWFSGLFGQDTRDSKGEGRARLADPQPVAPNPEDPIDATSAKTKQRDLDRLSHSDRKELSNLIDDL